MSSSKASVIPAGLGWDSLRRLDGDAWRPTTATSSLSWAKAAA